MRVEVFTIAYLDGVLQTIQAQARSHSGELLSEAQLNMTVQIPVSMTLDVRGGQLAVGREITIFPHGIGVCICIFLKYHF
jgi:hypothetical protein